MYCNKRCSGLGRRTDTRSETEKKADKAAYDRTYRAVNRSKLKRMRAAYFQRTYDPDAARAGRKKHMRRHVEYCRRYYADPKRHAAKVAYDLERRATEYGAWGEAYKVLLLLQRKVRELLPDRYERAKARGYFERTLAARRERRRTRDEIS